MLFTSFIISESLGAVICAPSSQYTLYPLYSDGLWLAVITIPAIHPRCLTAMIIPVLVLMMEKHML